MKRVGELLKAFLSQRLSREGESMLELVAAMRELAGDAAPHLRVRDVRSGTVLIEADHPGWGQLVSLRKPELLRALQGRFPEMEIRDIRVTVGTGAGDAKPSALGRESRAPRRGAAGSDATPSSPIEDVLARLPDDGLRRSLRGLYERADGPGESPPAGPAGDVPKSPRN